MPVSWAVDHALEDWYRSKMLKRKWPEEDHLPHAVRYCDQLAGECERVLRLNIRNGGGRINPGFMLEPAPTPTAETLTPPWQLPDNIQQHLIQAAVDMAFELVMWGGRASVDYDEAIDRVVHHVRESLCVSAVRYASKQNARAPACRRIPPELLCTILSHTSFRDQLAAAQVCSLWRAVARGAPRLWCDLQLCAPKRPEWDNHCLQADIDVDRNVVQQFLALSKGLPLSLSITDLRPWHVDTLQSSLGEHMSRMSRLEVQLAADSAQRTAVMLIQVLSKTAAPLLERFVLGSAGSSGASIPIDYGIFGGSAPRLAEVVLLSCTLGDSKRWAGGVFANVRTLTTPYTTGTAIARATQHLHLLCVFPRLTELTLCEVNEGAMLPFIDTDTALRKLTLHVPRYASPDALVEMLDPPHGRRPANRMRDHDRVREIELVFGELVSGAALRAVTRELPPWIHVGFVSDEVSRVRLSVWCGPDRVRHVVFRRPDDELLQIIRNNELFACAHVDEGWRVQLAKCSQDFLGDTLSAIRARFSLLPIGRRPSILV